MRGGNRTRINTEKTQKGGPVKGKKAGQRNERKGTGGKDQIAAQKKQSCLGETERLDPYGTAPENSASRTVY